MALYNNSAFGPPYKSNLQLVTGILPTYLFGQADSHTEPFLFNVSQVALATDIATLTVQLVGGGGGVAGGVPNPGPSVGAKMGVHGTTKASGVFNVDPTTVTAVTFDPSTGAGTISYALSHADVTAIADVGQVSVQPYETGDTVISSSASIPVSQVNTPDAADNSRCFYCESSWQGTMPTTATVVLQAANIDDDSRYAVVENTAGTLATGTVAASDLLASVAGGAVTQSGAEYRFVTSRFLRAKMLTYTGGDSSTKLVVTIYG